MSQYLTPHTGLRARLWFALRANPRFRYKALAVLGAALAALSYGAGIFGQREIRARIAATSITPITSLTAGLTGALYVSADRIDLWARTTSGSATLNLVEYNADDGKWAKVGADCSVDTNLTQCRYVAKRGSRYWHVYKASGTMSYVGLEPMTLPVGQAIGSIEPSGPGISLPLGVSDGGTGLTGFTANRLLYSSSTSAIGQLGCSDGQVPTWSSGAIVCATPASNGNCTILATVWDGGITTAGKFPAFDGVQWGAATAGSAMRRVLPAGSTWKIRAAITGAPGSGNTVKFEIQTSASLGGTFSADAASAVTFTNSDGANAIKTGSTFTVGGSAVIATIRAIATGADYGAPNQASVQLDCG